MTHNMVTRCAAALLLTFAFCPKSFGQTTDCESAAAACKAQCGTAAIYSHDGEGYLKQSDFKGRCERSCAAGLASCATQDSKRGCNTFVFHCVGTCPWTVIDTYADVTQRGTDSFQQCGKACSAGRASCQATRDTLPARKRTGTFDACEEAQGACYAHCMPGEAGYTDFPDQCAKACAQGVSPCKTAPATVKKCDEYFFQCGDACPDVSRDTVGNIGTETREGRKCLDACYAGGDHCRDMLR